VEVGEETQDLLQASEDGELALEGVLAEEQLKHRVLGVAIGLQAIDW